MALTTVQIFEKLRFNLFNSEDFFDVSHFSDPDVNFSNSIPIEQIK